jgi:hypothetical protein
MKTDGIEQPDTGTSVETRLRAAEQLCDVLRHRVNVLERERETLRMRLEGILSLLDDIVG